jgi:hypothetical protein
MARRMGADGVVYRTLAGGPARTLAVAWHRHRYHSQAAERFLAELRALCS